MVLTRPSRSGTVGSQPSFVFARAMSGRRRTGSSWGNGRKRERPRKGAFFHDERGWPIWVYFTRTPECDLKYSIVRVRPSRSGIVGSQ